MKHLTIISVALLAVLTACSSDDKQAVAEAAKQETQLKAANDSLQAVLAERDEVIALVGDIQNGVDSIAILERILDNPSSTESVNQRDQIKHKIAAIRVSIIERQARLDELEQRLNNSAVENANLRKGMAALRQQIATQVAEIERLTHDLNIANIEIENKVAAIDSLNIDLDRTIEQKDSVIQRNEQLVDESNVCYFAIGSKKELKEHNIIESGFLKKTKIMPEDFEQSYFTKGDKREIHTLPLHSKKAEIKTNQPKNSYTISKDADGMQVLTITNPTEFWRLSNYVVIQID